MTDSIPNIKQQITWVYTGELGVTAKFYGEVLRLNCLRESDQVRIFATAAGAAIGLCQLFGDREIAPQGSMISIVTDDVDGWYQRLQERGASIAEPPRSFARFGIYRFSVLDPNGYVIEFQQFDDDR